MYNIRVVSNQEGKINKMEQQETLEQEFLKAQFQHMVRVVKQYLIIKANKLEKSNTIQLPVFLEDAVAEATIMQQISRMLEHGTFRSVYNIAWESLNK